MKKIMILGAGVYQVPLIKKAKKLGLYTVVVSIPGNYPGFAFADQVVYEDTTNYESILRIAKELKIGGICTTGTDVAVSTIGRVCDELGLCGVSAEGAKYACDKMLMKQAFHEYRVNTAEFREVDVNSDLGNIMSICDDISYPVIFKAVDSSGSRGIMKVEAREQVEEAIEVVMSITKASHFIIEKYLVGTEFGAQAFVSNGELKMFVPHGDIVFMGDTGVPIGHYAPYGSEKLYNDAREELSKAVKAMKINNCAINADFILCDGEVYVLEIGARGGATCLTELVSIYFGYDYYEKIIKSALGESVSFEPKNDKRVPNASHLLMSDKSGVITDIQCENMESNGVFEIKYDFKIGDTVKKFHIGPDRIGHVVVYGDTLDEAMSCLEKVMKKIHITVE